jgi:hypothetical protein
MYSFNIITTLNEEDTECMLERKDGNLYVLLVKPLEKGPHIKAYRGADVKLHVFLTSAVDGCESSVSFSGRFTSGAQWIGAWMDPRAGLDMEAEKKKKKLPCPCRE